MLCVPQAAHLYDVFISYRRTFKPVAMALKLALHKQKLLAFLDCDRENGIGLGEFQSQLEKHLRDTAVMIVLMTPAPAGL